MDQRILFVALHPRWISGGVCIGIYVSEEASNLAIFLLATQNAIFYALALAHPRVHRMVWRMFVGLRRG